MGYFYLILQAFIFSFGGLMIKAAGGMFSPFLISGLRFAIGVAILLIILKVRSGHFRLPMASRILLAGGVCKALHYLPENFGIMRGFSYGGILVWPVQTVVILVFSALFRRERSFPIRQCSLWREKSESSRRKDSFPRTLLSCKRCF